MEIANLIEDYLTNRLTEQDKLAFENKMKENPELKAEVEIQKEIINGLRKARVAELKAMLNKVQVSTPTIYFTPLRIAAALIGTAVLATGLYFYYDKGVRLDPNALSSSIVDSIRQSEDKDNGLIKSADSLIIEPGTIDEEVITAPVVDDKNKESQSGDIIKAEKNKPALDIIDPTEELENSISNSIINNPKSIHTSNLAVEINSKDRKYTLHYQFTNKKLILYGSFDKPLYEIIEVNGTNETSLFLYYKSSYYLLNQLATDISPLKEISDPVLLENLKAYRAK